MANRHTIIQQGKRRRGSRRALVAALAALVVAALGAAPAAAESPWWQVASTATPTYLQPGGEGKVFVLVTNVGDGKIEGESSPVEVTDSLPAGLTATKIRSNLGPGGAHGEGKCSLSSQSVTCEFASNLPPYEALQLEITVEVANDARSGIENGVSVTGGGAPPVQITRPLTVAPGPTPFGVEDYKVALEGEDGSGGGGPDLQAGSHPFQLTSTLALNTKVAIARLGKKEPIPVPAALPQELSFRLPPGLVGNPTALPQCTDKQFTTKSGQSNADLCPPDTAVGVVVATVIESSFLGEEPLPYIVPLFNLTPSSGEPARLGFFVQDIPVVLDTSVRSGSDYGVDVTVKDASQEAGLLASQVTVWGVPGDSSHDQSRGWGCLIEGRAGGKEPCNPEGQRQPPAFLTLPTACAGPLTTTMTAESWEVPGVSAASRSEAEDQFPTDSNARALGLNGCNRLGFDPSITIAPNEQAASTPTGLTVDVHVPQETTVSATGLAESAIRDTTVTLPEGMQVSPASADGLEACSLGQVGFEPAGGSTPNTSFSPGAAACPEASKVGTVEIKTPLLPNPLTGAVYLAMQNANPFGSLLALYLVAEEPVSGVLVKLAGKVSPNSSTGQLVSTFEDTPQLPFEDLKLEFFSGAQAPVSTPPYCGTYTSAAAFAPWSGNAPVSSSSSFEIKTGADGAPCSDPLPFSPTLTAGSTDLQAGAFAPFSMTMSREDGNQDLDAIQLRTPPGLLGMLSSVQPCPEPLAAEGTCGPASLIGHTVVSVGLGSQPYTVSGGQVFITGPYEGAPYGLSVAEPAKAGPFDLGSGRCDCVVVRAKVEVDPHTSALTVTSGPLPQILDGIPLQIKHVNVKVDRPGFIFNPTNCSPLAITATVSGVGGSSAPASVPFQVANCATLPFAPKFTALTEGRTSKVDGAYLHVRVTSGPGQANIGGVKVDLPKQLPSRLTTLQKACVAAVFEVNPANCPAASMVGAATAITPALKSALAGPAYLVSHGGARFPDLEIVLQGERITLILDGNTHIKKGITSSTFRSVPDAPIASFDLVLPEGPHSVLGSNLPTKANWSMCGQRLAMPTEITGQNGAVIKQTTKIAISGCAKAKAKKGGKVSARRRKPAGS